MKGKLLKRLKFEASVFIVYDIEGDNIVIRNRMNGEYWSGYFNCFLKKKQYLSKIREFVKDSNIRGFERMIRNARYDYIVSRVNKIRVNKQKKNIKRKLKNF